MAPQANPMGLMSIGAVAAHNIAGALELPEDKIPVIEQAIKDEIGAMSSHFTLAVADAQTSYEVELAKIKSNFKYVKQNYGKIAGVLLATFAAGIVAGHFV